MKENIEITRLKKGYIVKEGDTGRKIFVTFSKKNITRSSFYKWLKRRDNRSSRKINRNEACKVLKKYHDDYPSLGYRWLNAKIKLDLGVIYSDNYSNKICKYLGIKSKSIKRYGKKTNREIKNFPNYILAELNPLRPFQLVFSDMTAFLANKTYYKLTLFMDLFNKEIVAFSLSNKRVIQTLIILV